jgi:amidase
MKSAYDSLDAVGMAELVAKGETTPGELLDIALERVSVINPHINAVVRMREDVARRRIAEGLPAGPLRGVPFLLKDLGCEAIDFPSNNGSRLLAVEHYPRDSAIFERIRDTGVVTFGRATSPEAGIGTATEAIVYGGPTRNPWNLARTAGGSSGGSAAAGNGHRRIPDPQRQGHGGACRCLRRRRSRCALLGPAAQALVSGRHHAPAGAPARCPV